MKKRSTHIFFLSLIGMMLPLFSHTILYAASEQESQTIPAAIDLDLIQEDLDFLTEETISIAALHEQPISKAPSNVYVFTEENIRHSGTIDIPTLLRSIPWMEVMQTTGADFNVSMRGDNQLTANKLLVQIDGRSISVAGQGVVSWKLIPVTLLEIKRIEVLKGQAEPRTDSMPLMGSSTLSRSLQMR